MLVLAPVVAPSAVTAMAAASTTPTIALIDWAIAEAKRANPKMRPIRLGPTECYAAHPRIWPVSIKTRFYYIAVSVGPAHEVAWLP